MSLSKAERKLPQYCAWHRHYFPKDKFRSFKAREGQFIQDKSLFVCHRCRRLHASHVKPTESPIEDMVAQSFRHQHFAFRQHFKLGEFVYDFAFPKHKILLETDGKSCHRYKPAGFKTKGSKEQTAKANGWKLIHVRNGPRLPDRARYAVVQAISS